MLDQLHDESAELKRREGTWLGLRLGPDEMDIAQAITLLLQRNFAEVPVVADCLAADVERIASILKDREIAR